MIVVACNAATSAALPELQQVLAVPVLGVITPEAYAAVRATRNRRIGLLATQATVTARRYETLIQTLDAGVRFSAVACPKLVPLIEGGDTFSEEVVEAVREYAAPVRDAGCDTVILGCTHFPLLRPVFQRAFGRDVTLVFSADETAREVAATLERKGIENAGTREGAYRFLTTGDPESFRVLGERFLQLPLGAVERVSLSQLGTVGGVSRNDGGGRPTCVRSSPIRRSSSSRTAWCSGRRARRACSAPRRSPRASRAGSSARGAAG